MDTQVVYDTWTQRYREEKVKSKSAKTYLSYASRIVPFIPSWIRAKHHELRYFHSRFFSFSPYKHNFEEAIQISNAMHPIVSFAANVTKYCNRQVGFCPKMQQTMCGDGVNIPATKCLELYSTSTFVFTRMRGLVQREPTISGWCTTLTGGRHTTIQTGT